MLNSVVLLCAIDALLHCSMLNVVMATLDIVCWRWRCSVYVFLVVVSTKLISLLVIVCAYASVAQWRRRLSGSGGREQGSGLAGPKGLQPKR